MGIQLKSFRGLLSALLIALVVLFCVGALQWHQRREVLIDQRRAILDQTQDVQQMMNSIGKLKPGMTEEQVADILGPGYWTRGFQEAGDILNVDVLNVYELPAQPHLCLLIGLNLRPVRTLSGVGYADPKTGRSIGVLKVAKIGPDPD